MSVCGVCNKVISTKQLKLTCYDCKRPFHGSCVGMNKVDIDTLNTESLPWRCLDCSADRRKSMRFEATATSDGLTLEDIMRELRELKEVQKKNTADFNASYELLYQKIDDANKSMALQSKRIDEYMERMEERDAENNRLRKQVEILQYKVDDLEQYSRKNCVEIQGVPSSKEEDVMNVVKKVGSAIDFQIDDSMIDNCHRIGRQLQDRGPPGIIVKFVRHIDKEAFLRKKKFKRSLTTRQLGLDSENTVYINESLSPARRKLFMMAKEAKKTKQYTYVWTRGGRIFMRKDGNSPAVMIASAEDLEKL